jgi:glycosyltransferase involved in cell wall biosynthesis
MVAAYRLLRAGRRVGVDMEDWFSEDLPPESRRTRPLRLLRKLEATLLRDGAYSSCTSLAMSRALEQEYGCRPPVVLHNSFAWAEREAIDYEPKDRRNGRAPSIHWYSQTLGPGRGLEDLLAALPHVNHDAEIHLRGAIGSGFREWLDTHTHVGWRERVFLHDLVPNAELLSRIAEHDIGFAGEMKYCRSRELTVTNKVLHYLLAGLAVIASDTEGQMEVAAQAPGAVLVYPSRSPLKLAELLNQLLASRDLLGAAKAAALRAAKQSFCWEKEAPTLVRSVEEALAR